MPFSAATAISRLTSGPQNAFQAGLTSGQQLQRLNEVISRFFEEGSWRGVHDTISLTSSSGIVTLSTAYQRLDGLGVPAQRAIIPIRSQQFAFSPSGPRPQDWTLYGDVIAIDLGDNASGQRRYQLSGDTTSNDALTLSGLARKRFNYINNTADTIFPDCYDAIVLGVKAFGCRDENNFNQYQQIFAEALRVLNGNLEEFEPENRQVTIQNNFNCGSLASVH